MIFVFVGNLESLENAHTMPVCKFNNYPPYLKRESITDMASTSCLHIYCIKTTGFTQHNKTKPDDMQTHSTSPDSLDFFFKV